MSNVIIPQNECFLLLEASSSATTLYSYSHDYSPNLIYNKTKLSFHGHRMSDYVVNNDATGYYSTIINNYQVKYHIINSHCNKYYLSIHATGGMRNAEDIHGMQLIGNFYSTLSQSVLYKKNYISKNIQKEISLISAKTITGQEEGYYAWITLKSKKDSECHSVIDLGGQTFQFANSTHQISTYLGKDRASTAIGDEVFESCHNDNNQYNGIQCKESIKTYLENNFHNTSIIDHSQHCETHAISSFYHYFNDLCKSYLPYIINNDLSIDSQILAKIKNYCENHENEKSFNVTAIDYIKITDEVCEYWGDWEGKQADFTKDLCFTGNYAYELLKILNFTDTHEININNIDWSLGSVISTSESLLIQPYY